MPSMQAKGWGRIVNMGGVSAHMGMAERAHVSAAKAGLIGFTKGLAKEFGLAGITVNCVVPGVIDTVRDPGGLSPGRRARCPSPSAARAARRSGRNGRASLPPGKRLHHRRDHPCERGRLPALNVSRPMTAAHRKA